ncbi:hypothetical protein A2841_00110 [Candidatus Kaiserbacteria bacterium RIFCSPHIGHO2_01_FULL_48_10]|uniref:ATP synthase subunit b n=1 Tax=Candidatus Kaiserbacteria bacterium RIFCSPHIGHO2_01_FULL_48_10 TaxID=1798476 RepID=A0A1F6C5N2_9BACT|nr:MAG: hypothetical protein A2841_00110 [Candidatus Kaiserbacteria bacterium RIFCSPHIGHO2_01_FULL_48_10]
MELLGQLGINGTLLLAQAVNFLLLLWILNRFLYKPIVKMLDERKAKAESMQLSESKMEEKKKQFEQWTDGQVADARRKAELILVEAEKFSGKIKTRKMDELSLEKQRVLLDGHKQLDRDRLTLERELRETIAREASRNVEKFFQSLGNLGNTGLHAILVDKTLDELDGFQLDKPQLAKVIQAQIQTAVELSKAEREKIQKALEKRTGHSLKISSAIDPDLIAGIRIILGGFEFDGSLVGRLKK